MVFCLGSYCLQLNYYVFVHFRFSSSRFGLDFIGNKCSILALYSVETMQYKVLSLSVSEFTTMPEKLFKVIIIGDPTVGKTSFVQRYVQNSFKRDYKGTVGVDFALKILKWSEAQTIKLQLWDIAGELQLCPLASGLPIFFIPFT